MIVWPILNAVLINLVGYSFDKGMATNNVLGIFEQKHKSEVVQSYNNKSIMEVG